jgi:hypothetical protein
MNGFLGYGDDSPEDLGKIFYRRAIETYQAVSVVDD